MGNQDSRPKAQASDPALETNLSLNYANTIIKGNLRRMNR